jgi:hypothetical protein
MDSRDCFLDLVPRLTCSRTALNQKTNLLRSHNAKISN